MDKEHAALRLDADGRVLGAAWHRTQPEGAVIIRRDELPEGDVTQYRYEGGAFVYDPLPETPEPVETTMSATCPGGSGRTGGAYLVRYNRAQLHKG